MMTIFIPVIDLTVVLTAELAYQLVVAAFALGMLNTVRKVISRK